MKELLKAHNVSPSFLSVLLAAGEPPRESEEGFGNSILNEYRDGSFCQSPRKSTRKAFVLTL
jgi:hypothetical protein